MKQLSKILYLGLLCLLLAPSSSIFGQKSVRDSAIIIPHFDVVYSFQIPGGDLSDRFGYYHTIGGAFYVKDRKGFIYGFDGQYQFGNQVKELTIGNLLTSNGAIIDANGEYSTIQLYMRGFRFTGQFGKLFNVLGANPNSGLKVLVGAGFWQHRIRVDDPHLNTPQISFPYQKGYDRMSNGFMLTEFIGYQYFSDSRLVNFYIGMEFNQGFTQNRRKYNFSEKRQDTSQRTDLSYGFKLGWVIPFYKKAPKEFYYR